jgi:hypothetical protein
LANCAAKGLMLANLSCNCALVFSTIRLEATRFLSGTTGAGSEVLLQDQTAIDSVSASNNFINRWGFNMVLVF